MRAVWRETKNSWAGWERNCVRIFWSGIREAEGWSGKRKKNGIQESEFSE
jgi:hypothetical protein